MNKQSIEYQRTTTEAVYVNLPAPEEPTPEMSGADLLHGFLAELHRNDELRAYLNGVCNKWNIRFREV